MSRVDLLTQVPRALTSRRGAWVSLGLSLLAMALLFGWLGTAQAPARTGLAPAGSESQRVAELLREWPDADVQSVLVVASRSDGQVLSAKDLAALESLRPVLDAMSVAPSTGPMVSADSVAALFTVPMSIGKDPQASTPVIEAMRGDLAGLQPHGLDLAVTGGAAFAADIASSFDGANLLLLLVTLGIVTILLIVTYRSPILWLVPLTVIALADGLAGRLTAAAGSAWSLAFDAGIVSVLVFGAGTNYALLLISRYREELATTSDHREALRRAWRGAAPAIVASNVTVVLALLTLVLASTPLTRGLGVPAAIGLLVALVAVLFVLPPVLAVCGRRIFWPFIPRPGAQRASGRGWRGIATTVVGRPWTSLAAGLALLAVMTVGLAGTSIGLDQLHKFRVQTESAAGLETLAAHFPPGLAQPIMVVTNTGAADAVVTALEGSADVVAAELAGNTPDGSLTKIVVTGAPMPGHEQSLEQIQRLRAIAHAVPGAEALVGGQVADDLDARNGNLADFARIVPLILLVSFVVLLILLRSIVAPVLLLIVNVASAVAAIGAGAWLSRVLLDLPALDAQVPLLAFLFLVALGIDYTIFLVHRARTEAMTLGTRAGMIEAIARTGAVITSAGIVLAAVFAALGVLPLVTLGQLGLIVGVGVIVDTIVVRTVIVPAMFSVVGDRIWWPGRMTLPPAQSAP